MYLYGCKDCVCLVILFCDLFHVLCGLHIMNILKHRLCMYHRFLSYCLSLGRTGRAGRPGKAVTFFTEDDTVNLRR
jgi:hypothetical protein